MKHERPGRPHALAAALLLLAAPLAGCARTSAFEGVSFALAETPGEVSELARRASRGDKQAQLELGIRYEHGEGVPVNWRRAARLYEMAATTTGGASMMYVAPIRRGQVGRDRGTSVPVNLGPWAPGLNEARVRLDRLRERRRAERRGRSGLGTSAPGAI